MSRHSEPYEFPFRKVLQHKTENTFRYLYQGNSSLLSHAENLKQTKLPIDIVSNERNNNFHIIGYNFHTQWLSINADWSSFDGTETMGNVYIICVAMVIKNFNVSSLFFPSLFK